MAPANPGLVILYTGFQNFRVGTGCPQGGYGQGD